MYQLKGFASIETLVSNIDGVVAPIGELSTYSATFSKEKKIYPSNLNSCVTIYTFSSISSLTGTIAPVANIVLLGHAILDWIYTRQMNSVVIESKQQFMNALSSNFVNECDGVICGELLNAVNGKQFPEWISWKTRAYEEEDNVTTIWLSDQSFRQKYDNYELVVVPPIPNIDSFFSTATAVQSLVSSVTHVDRLNSIQLARNDHPETVLVGVSFNWVDPVNSTHLINTNWSILVYGPNGNDNDIIREAIALYILENTTHTELEWRAIFPDIFRRTEFLFFPRWHNYAIPNMVLQAGIYSPVVYATKEITYLKSILSPATGYSDAFVTAHASVMPHPYKCLALDVIGGYENRENLFDITQIYPDILNVSTTSVDYNRMTAQTQGLLSRLTEMILIAETLTYYSDIPVGYRKVERYGIMFVTTRYMNIELLVSSKLSTPHYA
jgi:hypothetical protein